MDTKGPDKKKAKKGGGPPGRRPKWRFSSVLTFSSPVPVNAWFIHRRKYSSITYVWCCIRSRCTYCCAVVVFFCADHCGCFIERGCSVTGYQYRIDTVLVWLPIICISNVGIFWSSRHRFLSLQKNKGQNALTRKKMCNPCFSVLKNVACWLYDVVCSVK